MTVGCENTQEAIKKKLRTFQTFRTWLAKKSPKKKDSEFNQSGDSLPNHQLMSPKTNKFETLTQKKEEYQKCNITIALAHIESWLLVQ